VEPYLQQKPELGLDAGYGGWFGVYREHKRPQDPRFRRSQGNLLWDFPTNSGILAPPTSFLIDGKQYVAVPAKEKNYSTP
jgi:hypothetical protein